MDDRATKQAQTRAQLKREMKTDNVTTEDLARSLGIYPPKAPAKEEAEARRSAAACSRSSDTPETDAIAAMRRTTIEWRKHSEKLERQRNELARELKWCLDWAPDKAAKKASRMIAAILSENVQRHPFGRERHVDEAPNHDPTNDR